MYAYRLNLALSQHPFSCPKVCFMYRRMGEKSVINKKMKRLYFSVYFYLCHGVEDGEIVANGVDWYFFFFNTGVSSDLIVMFWFTVDFCVVLSETVAFCVRLFCCVCFCLFTHFFFFYPFTAPAYKIQGWNLQGPTCKQYIFWSYDASNFNAMHFDENLFICQS